jgi:Tol biopolymer transport system component
VKATYLGWAIGIALLLSAASADAQYTFYGRLTSPEVGEQLTSGGSQPSVSPDGRYVAFVSSSSNMGAASNGSQNLYRYDLVSDTFELATQTLGTGNSNGPSISLLGLAIAFPSLADDIASGPVSGVSDIFYTARDEAGDWSTELVSRGVGATVPNGASVNASLSADGRWIAFHSSASNLIAGDTNGQPDIFVADAENLAAAPERISVTNGGAQIEGPSRALSPSSISADGRYVAFAVDTPVSIDGSNAGTLEDVFVRDRLAGTTSLMSKSTAGVPGSSSSDSPAISPSGRFVVFRSFGNLTDGAATGSRIYLRDRQENFTFNMPLPPGASTCEDPRVSDLAQIVAQCNMNTGFAQAFLYDPAGEGAFYQLSTSIGEGNGNATSANFSSISADGVITVFDSDASDLVPDDTNSSPDIFVVVPEAGVAGASLAAIGALALLRRRGPARRRRHSV